MSRLKILSGKEVCKILLANGFVQVRQKGSHIIMQKKVLNNTITVPVPNHFEIKRELYSPSSASLEFPKKNSEANNI